MKITGVKTTLFRCEPPQGTLCLVELSTDEGLSGIGIGQEDVEGPVTTLVEAVLIGEDPGSATGLWQRMEQRGADSTCAAMAILDMALWDLKARANGEPLWKTLGARRPKLNAYAGVMAETPDDEKFFNWYSTMARDFGVRGGKLQASGDQGTNHRRLGLMKDALSHAGRQPELMIRAHESWSPEQAIANVAEMEREYDLTWVENPVSSRDIPGLRQVSDGIYAAVCAGECLAVPEDYLPYFRNHAVDVIRLDIGVLGITASLQLADAAYGLELPVTLGASPGNIHAQVAAAMPNVMSVEIVDPSPDGIFSTDVRIGDGWAIAGDAPGSGLTIDRDALARSALVKSTDKSGNSRNMRASD